MKYDFEAAVDRKGTSCIKWDFQQDGFGRDGLLPFTIADADYKACPKVLAALRQRIDHGILGYTDPDARYNRAVADWCKTRHGWAVEPDWIVPVPGIVPGISFVLEAVTAPGDKILVQTPVYDPFFSVVEATGRTLVKCPLTQAGESGAYQMDFEALQASFSQGVTAMILCNPHNPVGRVWTRDEMARLVALCKAYNVLLISDEIHWDLMIDGHAHTTAGLWADEYKNMVVCTSASKSFNIAGLQTSNFIIPCPGFREEFRNYLYGRYIFCPNALGMLATQTAYEQGADWLDEQLVHLSQNAHAVNAFLAQRLPKVKAAPLEGTFLMWLDCSAYGIESSELIRRFAEEGAAFGDGDHYGPAHTGFVRMNIACPRQQLQQGLEAIARALNKLQGGDL